MKVSELETLFGASPAIRLLRAASAPYVIAFLHAEFKQSGNITVNHQDLVTALALFQDQLQKSHSDALRDRPETYLTDWCSEDKRWLYRFLEADRDEPVYQLTPYTEQAIDFLDQALHRNGSFVGTESRLRLVIDTLQNLAVGASDDPTVHLNSLRSQKAAIERQITQIESERAVTAFHPTRVREQFGLAVTMLKELEGDFRAVEERFRDITQDVRQRQLTGTDSRGGILGDALDAEDALRMDDQGVSFYEFFRLIQSTDQQQQLRDTIGHLIRLPELTEQHDGLQTIRRMMPQLLTEAAKVTKTERRLSATLKRMLDTRSRQERARVAELLHEIRGLAVTLSEHPPVDDVYVEVDSAISLQSPVSRPFWTKPTDFETIDLTEPTPDVETRRSLFREFADMRRIDFGVMRSRIHELTQQHGSITLQELLESDPPQAGILDVLGYLQIASDDGHLIDHDRPPDEVVVSEGSATGGPTLLVTVPSVTFVATKASVA